MPKQKARLVPFAVALKLLGLYMYKLITGQENI